MAPDYPPQLLTELKQIQQAALSSDYAYQQVAHLANNIGPRLIAAIESDLGADHPLGFNIKAKSGVLPLLAPVSTVLRSSGACLMRLTGSIETDISPLADEGLPCFGLWQDSRTYFNFHHTAADTLDKIVPKELSENGAVMAVLAYALANLPQPLPR